MSKDETASIIKLLLSAYGDKFYRGQNPGEVAKLWQRVFSEDDYRLVENAVYEVLNASIYPPSIAEIRAKLPARKAVAEASKPVQGTGNTIHGFPIMNDGTVEVSRFMRVSRNVFDSPDISDWETIWRMQNGTTRFEMAEYVSAKERINLRATAL